MTPDLGGGDKPDTDRRAAARTFEGRERRLGLSQCWNEPQAVGIGHSAFALGASEFATTQLGVRSL